MRVAVSGSHGVGKSTLIAAFLKAHPSYAHEPEAFEFLADEIELTSSEGPTPEGMHQLLEYTMAAVSRHKPGDSVVFERSPVDYLAYAAASERSWPRGAVASFLENGIPSVRRALQHLDRIVFVPLVSRLPPRPGESPRFRKRVDEALRRALLDDAYDLLGEPTSPRIVELSRFPERWPTELAELVARS